MVELTTAEVVALFGVSESQVRKDVEHGLFATSSPPRFSLPQAAYFEALGSLGFQLAVKDRERLYRLIANALEQRRVPERVAWTPVLELRLGEIVKQVKARLKAFDAWKRKAVVLCDDTLGGEPTFAGSRLAVRHVGGMLLAGVSPDEVREDYPQLTEEDLEFSKLYAQAYPRRGRPRA